MKILIVDDSPVARQMMKFSLPKIETEFTIIEGADGEQAISLYLEHLPDYTFLDLTMPILSGVDALKKIKELQSDSKIIIVSGDIQPKRRQEVLKLGATEMINKPISSDALAEFFRKEGVK